MSVDLHRFGRPVGRWCVRSSSQRRPGPGRETSICDLPRDNGVTFHKGLVSGAPFAPTASPCHLPGRVEMSQRPAHSDALGYVDRVEMHGLLTRDWPRPTGPSESTLGWWMYQYWHRAEVRH